MTIDLRTVIIIAGFTHLMQVVVFFYQYKANKVYKGIGWWLLWSAAETLGFIFMLLRDIPSIFPLVVIIQNTAIISGTIFIYIGVMRFFGKKENLKIIIPVFVFYISALLFFLFVHNNIQIRSGIINTVLALISFLTAISLYKNKIPSIKATANFNVAVFVLHGGIFSYRTVLIFFGTSLTDIFSATIFNILPYFDALIVALLWTFGFIIMVNQRLNAEMTEAKEHFEKIFNTSPDAVIISQIKDGMIIDINSGFTTLTGFTREESVGKSSLEINIWKNPEDRQRAVNELLEKGSCDNFEAVLRKKDGTELTGLMSAKIIYLQGQPNIISVMRDITERKHTGEALRILSIRQEAILESVPEIIMEVDENKVYTWANKVGKEFFGDDVLGKEASYYFEGEQETLNTVQPLFEGMEDVIYVESWQRRFDGEKRLLGWWCKIVKDENGNFSRALSTARDITEEKQAEGKIREKAAELERFNNLMIGRELKMVELKEEINELLRKSGKEEKYRIAGKEKPISGTKKGERQ